jgi:hypothetical protein
MRRNALSAVFALLMVASVARAQSDSVSTAPPESTRAIAPTQAAVSAPNHIKPKDKVFIDQSDFGMALAAAILKKEVPVSVVADSSKADFWIATTSKESHEGGAERVAKVLTFGGFAGSGKHFDATVTIRNRDGVIVFAYNSQKGNFQSAAQNVAKNIKKHIEENQTD